MNDEPIKFDERVGGISLGLDKLELEFVPGSDELFYLKRGNDYIGRDGKRVLFQQPPASE